MISRDIPLERIVIKTDRDSGDLKTLSQSIKTYGVIQPVVVEDLGLDGFLLIAGRRRYKASVLTGRETIPAVFREELTPPLRRELELEENLHRKNLTWAEEVEIKAQIDELKREIHGHAMQGKGVGFGQRELAESLNESLGKTNQDLKLAKFLRENKGTRIAQEITNLPKKAAIRRVKQHQSSKKYQAKFDSGEIKPQEGFFHADVREALYGLGDESIDLIITDPPWGQDELEKATAKQTLITESDNLNSKEAAKLFSFAAPELFRILCPGRFIFVFTGIDSCEPFRLSLELSGFKIFRYPIVWDKQKNQVGFFGFNFMRSYELILYGYKPTKDVTEMKTLKTPCRDVIQFDPLSSSARSHAFEKPQDLLKFLIEQGSNLGESVLDPFAGVASVHRAARVLGRVPTSFEIDQIHYTIGSELLRKGK